MHHSEGSDHSYKASNKDVKDDKDLQLAKWHKLCLPPTYKGLPPQLQNLTLPSATQLMDTLRCDN